jgi:hypothetical protein
MLECKKIDLKAPGDDFKKNARATLFLTDRSRIGYRYVTVATPKVAPNPFVNSTRSCSVVATSIGGSWSVIMDVSFADPVPLEPQLTMVHEDTWLCCCPPLDVPPSRSPISASPRWLSNLLLGSHAAVMPYRDVGVDHGIDLEWRDSSATYMTSICRYIKDRCKGDLFQIHTCLMAWVSFKISLEKAYMRYEDRIKDNIFCVSLWENWYAGKIAEIFKEEKLLSLRPFWQFEEKRTIIIRSKKYSRA